MSNQAQFWVWEFSQSSGLDRLVLLTLAHRHNLEHKGCWPSYRKIAEDCGISERTVMRCVQSLSELGEVHCRERKIDDGVNTSNFYTLPAFEHWYSGVHKTPVVTNRHPPPDTQSPPRVTHSHPEGDTQSPELGIELGSNELEREQEDALAFGSPEFKRFWALYPVKTGRKAALAQWCKQMLDDAVLKVLDSLARWKACERWQDPQFIPYAEKWLNDQWRSEPVKGVSKNEQKRRKTAEAIERVRAKIANS